METLTPALAFIAAHAQDLFAVIGALVTAASVIVKLTPSTTDDTVLAKVVRVLDWVSVVYPKVKPAEAAK